MAEDEGARGSPFAASGGAFLAATLGTVSDNPRVDTLIDRQVALAELQIENLQKQDEYETSHLRWRRFNDQMGGALQIMLVALGLLIVVGLGAALWTAAHDNGLVIEAFSVPPDMAQRGLNGQVVAGQLLDKLVAMQAATKSARPAASYSNNWGSDIKIEIPDTGVSVGEAYRSLAGWLGNETHITGEVYRTAAGIAVTARAGSDGGATLSGSEAQLDKLLQQAAEDLYRRTQPYRYAVYLQQRGPDHLAQSRAVFESLIAGDSTRERAWAYAGLAIMDGIFGDPQRAPDDARRAIAQLPTFALAYVDLDDSEATLGHDEASLAAARRGVRVYQDGGDIEIDERAGPTVLAGLQSDVAFALNDFPAALGFARQMLVLPNYGVSVENGRQGMIITSALLHDGGATRRAIADLPATSDIATLWQHTASVMLANYWLEQWNAVVAARAPYEKLMDATIRSGGYSAGFADAIQSRQEWPYVAAAMALTGDLKGAQALIDKTPLDCYACVRSRAVIAAAAHRWGAAAYWFGIATDQAPSIPVGWSQWGAMLLHMGDPGAAIAKLTIAHAKGPHFADPLELWGEALIAKNRSDLALAKFAEANKYAPNWGRLHLKWGEALFWLGRKDDAKMQFTLAAKLDLTAPDRAQLARLDNQHG